MDEWSRINVIRLDLSHIFEQLVWLSSPSKPGTYIDIELEAWEQKDLSCISQKYP